MVAMAMHTTVSVGDFGNPKCQRTCWIHFASARTKYVDYRPHSP